MERYGLLNIIVLGEVLVSLSLALGHLYEGTFDVAFIVTAVSGLAIVFALWWAYFVEQDHLENRDFGRAFLWGYGHVFVFASGALLAAGIGAYTDALTHHAHIDARGALVFVNLPVAVYFLTLWLIRDRFHGLGWHGYVLPGAAVALVLAGAGGAPLPLTAVIAVAAAALRRPAQASATEADAH
jgi:low temperature requirement protein LtrA